jgi:hypothetical protein
MRIWLGIGIVVLLAIIIIPAGRHPHAPFSYPNAVSDRISSCYHKGELIQRQL